MGCRDFPSTREHGVLYRRVEELETVTKEQEERVVGLSAENNLLSESLSTLSGVVAELAGNMAGLTEELQALRLLSHDHAREH